MSKYWIEEWLMVIGIFLQKGYILYKNIKRKIFVWKSKNKDGSVRVGDKDYFIH